MYVRMYVCMRDIKTLLLVKNERQETTQNTTVTKSAACASYNYVTYIKYACMYACVINTYQISFQVVKLSIKDASSLLVFELIQGQFPAFQRFSSSKLVLKTVESRFPTLNYFANASIAVINLE
jgi:hypothetical protein